MGSNLVGWFSVLTPPLIEAKIAPGAAYGCLLGLLKIITTNPKCNNPGIGYQAGSPYGLASRHAGVCLGVSRRWAMYPASAREHWLLTPPLPKREKNEAARIATPSQIRVRFRLPYSGRGWEPP